jgi:plasmid stabilization system protein ParE
MAYEISADLRSFVAEQISLGCFVSEQQLVDEAVRMLKAERDETVQGIRQGLSDAAAERVQPLADAFVDLRREFGLSDPAWRTGWLSPRRPSRIYEAAYLWAADRAPQTAAAWLARFERELATLAYSPKRGQLAPENELVDEEIRQLIFGRRQGAYRALYTIVGDEVRVLHIRRAARDWASSEDIAPDS